VIPCVGGAVITGHLSLHTHTHTHTQTHTHTHTHTQCSAVREVSVCLRRLLVLSPVKLYVFLYFFPSLSTADPICHLVYVFATPSDVLNVCLL